MADTLEKKLRIVQIKCSVNLLLEQAGYCLIIAGILAFLGILVERLFGLTIVNTWSKWALWVTSAICIAALWVYKQPGRMNVSVLVDKKLRLKERFSTALALAKSDDPFARAACIEAHKVAERINPARQFPFRLSERWLYAGAIWLSFTLLTLYLPQKDLLGFLKHKQEQQQQAQQVELTQKTIAQAAKDVTAAVKQLNDEQLDSEMAKLAELPKEFSPDAAKRQTIQKLGDLADRVKQMQTSANLGSVELMKNMLKQLRGSQGQEMAELKLAMAKGDFGQAANLLEKLAKQLDEGSFSDQQKKELTERLQELSKELKQLAEENKAFEKELEKMGLEKNLAKLDKEQLQKALQNKGLSSEKIEQLLEKMEASKMAAGKCSGLADAMGAAGMGSAGLSGSDLAEAIGQLSELESLQQQVKLSQATLDEIERAVASLGEGLCEGIGGQGAFMEGYSEKFGSGTGGPGRGFGPRGSDEQGDTSTTSTKARGQTQQGPVIASWYFKGSSVKGEAKRDFASVIQSARDGAAEAINENQVPKKYEEAVKKYFGQLEQSVDKK